MFYIYSLHLVSFQLLVSVPSLTSRNNTIMPSTQTTKRALPWPRQRLTRKQKAQLQVAQYDPRPDQTSGLFSIPPELRNAIYELLIVEQDDALRVVAKRNHEYAGLKPSPPPLCQVCHEIRNETLPIFYGVNVFSMTLLCHSNVAMAKGWLRETGNVKLSMVRHLRLRSYPFIPKWSSTGIGSTISVEVGEGAEYTINASFVYDCNYTNADLLEQSARARSAIRRMTESADDLDMVAGYSGVIDAVASVCTFD